MMPSPCAADKEHRELAGVPEEVMFTSKPRWLIPCRTADPRGDTMITTNYRRRIGKGIHIECRSGNS